MVNVYGLSDEGSKLVAVAAEIAKDTVRKHAADVDASARFPTESIAALAESGLNGICLPREVGGKEQPPRTFAAVAETLAKECGSTAMVYVMHVAATMPIAASTTLTDKEALLRAIAAGKHLTTLAFSERGSRSQFWAPVSKLVAAGDGYVTSALKSWVTSASHADSYVSSALVSNPASPVDSVLYLVRDNPGSRVTSSFDGLGLRGNDSSPVAFEHLSVRGGDLLTEAGKGLEGMLQVVLPWFVVGTSAMALGVSQAAIDATAGHLAGTGFEHSGQALRDLPTLRARLAEMHVRTMQARALLAFTCADMEHASETTPLHVLSTRAAALESALHTTDLAMRSCGGAAFSRHLPIERMFRDARAGWVMAPTVDHLYDFVGKALTGLPLM